MVQREYLGIIVRMFSTSVRYFCIGIMSMQCQFGKIEVICGPLPTVFIITVMDNTRVSQYAVGGPTLVYWQHTRASI